MLGSRRSTVSEALLRVETDKERTDEVCHWLDTVFVECHKGSSKLATRKDLQRTLDMISERIKTDEDLTNKDCYWLEVVFVARHKVIVEAVNEGWCCRVQTDD